MSCKRLGASCSLIRNVEYCLDAKISTVQFMHPGNMTVMSFPFCKIPSVIELITYQKEGKSRGVGFFFFFLGVGERKTQTLRGRALRFGHSIISIQVQMIEAINVLYSLKIL